jgi:hypothetical protein
MRGKIGEKIVLVEKLRNHRAQKRERRNIFMNRSISTLFEDVKGLSKLALLCQLCVHVDFSMLKEGIDGGLPIDIKPLILLQCKTEEVRIKVK